MTDPSLEDLRVRALDGDRAALSSLCAALGARLFPLALRVLGDIRDAEDATQEILVKIVTHLAQFEGRSQLGTWAHTVAIRHLRGVRASRAEARAIDVESFAALLDQGLAFGAESPAPTPEDRLLLDEVRLSCTQGMLPSALSENVSEESEAGVEGGGTRRRMVRSKPLDDLRGEASKVAQGDGQQCRRQELVDDLEQCPHLRRAGLDRVRQ